MAGARRSVLREIRRASGLTQKGLAARAGLAVRTLQYLEAGVTAPSARTLQALREVLGDGVLRMLDRYTS